ncbi:2-phosphosulfolactate phosphatase [Jeotgalibacillus sp. R-1-5s-1]|uniref:2-phosphosulfolactate phosphatase n=1 Tax=Jeotgalibacillus sp. R-1-5s-1 TaxID=2555897 RepID=UPI00106B9A95|nr:2-phosphosulfolactate phosphatase [Jeotgalibacillus sp. R-1-5s-1]TFD93577.1 2-phosphosulfolactate phosphatase [Jeotgalibacillus sp. R-1-5s-1]
MFDQHGYEIKLEWGRRGAREAAERGDIIIIVDVLSFSSTVTAAMNVQATIFPYPPSQDGKRYAKEKDAEYILGRAEAAKRGLPTLSPVTFGSEHANKRFVLSSLNGAHCTWLAADVPALLIGSLRNAAATAKAANELQMKLRKDITLVPCGEQWNQPLQHEDSLRPSIEDYLGAGAILAGLTGRISPEAALCKMAFEHGKSELGELIFECGSGRELRERGFEADVHYCSQLNADNVVPILNKDHFIKY